MIGMDYHIAGKTKEGYLKELSTTEITRGIVWVIEAEEIRTSEEVDQLPIEEERLDDHDLDLQRLRVHRKS